MGTGLPATGWGIPHREAHRPVPSPVVTVTSVPSPLVVPRAAGSILGRDADWQMALGERAAIEGLLADRRPALSIELGTAEGGSLDRIAAHSGEVHTFDLEPHVDPAAYPNVTFHVGDSHVLLPRVLDEFARDGRNVDFALVDGDHSADGARRDLEDLLRSDAVRATYIVLHDTMNEAVLDGLLSIDLDAFPKVVFCDFAFTQLHQRPSGMEEIWGGLGLVVCDADDTLGVRHERRDRDRSLRGAVTAGGWRALAPARSARRRARRSAREVKARLGR